MRIFGWHVPMWFALLVWLALWEAAGRAELMFLIPPASDVLRVALTLWSNTKFLHAVAISLEALGAGLGLALVIGIPLGMITARFRAVEQLVSMWVNIFLSAPLTAVVPLLMAVIGIGQTTVIVTVFLFALWVIVLDTHAGFQHIDRSLQEMALSFGANRWALYTKVLIWAALPEVLTGVRLGFIRGVRGIVVGQLLVSIIGLGELFELYSRNFLMDHFWAVILYVFAFAFLLSEGVGYLERRIEYYASARGA